MTGEIGRRRLGGVPTIGGGLVLAAYVLLAGFVTWRLVGRYTNPWTGYVRPARAYLLAAQAADSLGLHRLGAPDQLIRGTLSAVALDSGAFGGADRLQVVRGERDGDTTRITFYHGVCGGRILVLSFIGARRLVAASRPGATPCRSAGAAIDS